VQKYTEADCKNAHTQTKGKAMTDTPFDALLAEAAAVPVDGWDFSWFEGRATEQRPSWGYSALLARRMAMAQAALDLQTGGGEVLAGLAKRPPVMVVTESWPPNVALAQRKLGPLGVQVVSVADEADLPFSADSFDLVCSRHPTLNRWDEIARVLAPGGFYLSQQIGAGTAGELVEAMVGSRPLVPAELTPAWASAAAKSAGLMVVRLRAEALRMEFFDIAAVAVFLRKVVWTVPDFTISRYREPLHQLHQRILAEGSFVAQSRRFLIEACKPRH
jgi:SAM-dependent methyltransferase